MRLTLPLGLLIAFGPFLLIRFVSEAAVLVEPQSFTSLGFGVALQLALVFLEIVVGAAFLTRAYQEVKARLAAASAVLE